MQPCPVIPPAAPAPRPAGVLATLADHWPEYLIEAAALGVFMVSAGLVVTALEYPGSPLHALLPDADVRRVVVGIAMGLTAIALIYSPWGQRSGAHMNPAVTLAFLALRRVRPIDAAGYVLAHFAGGLLGVLLVLAVLGHAFAEPPVAHVATLPGTHGTGVAFAAETVISGLTMAMVLAVSGSALARFTGLFAGLLVAVWIAVEAPLSGMSMNPARSFASALPGAHWQAFWVYLAAPVLGMQLAALAHRAVAGRRARGCAKLQHPPHVRCIHCGHEPHRSSPESRS